MTDTRSLPPARNRSRRVIQVDDAAPVQPAPRPTPTDEGSFQYGDSFSATPSIRYRQIKAVEGRGPARDYAKAQLLRLLFSGVSTQECAQTFGFSVSYTQALIAEAKREVREKATSGFDGMNVVAEHLTLYRHLRENAYFTMQRGNVSEVDKHRARESLLNIMRTEFEFVTNVGGMRGISLQSSNEDEAVVAARNMSSRITTLIDQLDDIMIEDGDEIAPTGPGDDAAEEEVEEA